MRAVIQRVSQAQVVIKGEAKSEIGIGLLVLIGIEDSDDELDIQWLSNKIANLRVFSDEHGIPNKSLLQVDGEILLVSQFTLHASTKKGNRPSYIKASKPKIAFPIYEAFIRQLEHDLGHSIQTGKFGADMKVSLTNDGPITIIIDTKNREWN